jgi:hypothetical protein
MEPPDRVSNGAFASIFAGQRTASRRRPEPLPMASLRLASAPASRTLDLPPNYAVERESWKIQELLEGTVAAQKSAKLPSTMFYRAVL